MNNPHFICNPIIGKFMTVGDEEKEKSFMDWWFLEKRSDGAVVKICELNFNV